MFVVILISLNLLYPYTFTGVWYRTFLLLGAIASFYTYQKLKQTKNDSWISRSLSRLNYMFLLVMFLCFFIVFLNKDILYNVYIFPFYLILIYPYRQWWPVRCQAPSILSLCGLSLIFRRFCIRKSWCEPALRTEFHSFPFFSPDYLYLAGFAFLIHSFPWSVSWAGVVWSFRRLFPAPRLPADWSGRCFPRTWSPFCPLR